MLCGTNCCGCGYPQRSGYFLPLQNYTVQGGDHLAWRQKQSGPGVPRGGIVLRFTDGSYTNWTTTDQNGEVMNSLSVQNQWVGRVVDLSPFAGRTQDLCWMIEDAQSGAGDWDERFADIALIHSDGSVRTLYNGEKSYTFTSSGSDPYMTNLSAEVIRSATFFRSWTGSTRVVSTSSHSRNGSTPALPQVGWSFTFLLH